MNKIILALFLFLIGCSSYNPAIIEDRTVKPYRSQKQVFFHQSMLCLDDDAPSKALNLPKGRYVMEAEDQNFFYFAAPKKIEVQTFVNQVPSTGRLVAGGLYLNKDPNSEVPAGAYLTIDKENKTLIWKLSEDFYELEGFQWWKNF